MNRVLRFLYRIYRSLMPIPALLLAGPFIVLGWLSHRVHGTITEPALVLSRIPFLLGEKTRLFYYKALLQCVGRRVTFKYGSFCQYRNSKIGNRVFLGYFNALGDVDIGDNVLFGGYVNVLSGLRQHAFEDPDKLIMDTPAPGRRTVTIGSDVWIGSNSVIADNVGNRCVVAACSVVLKEVEDHSLVGGNPARLIRKI